MFSSPIVSAAGYKTAEKKMLRPAGVVLLLLVATHAADQTLFEDFETGFVGTDVRPHT